MRRPRSGRSLELFAAAAASFQHHALDNGLFAYNKTIMFFFSAWEFSSSGVRMNLPSERLPSEQLDKVR